MKTDLHATQGIQLDAQGVIAGFGPVKARPVARQERAAFHQSGGLTQEQPEGRRLSWGLRLKSGCVRCWQHLAAVILR